MPRLTNFSGCSSGSSTTSLSLSIISLLPAKVVDVLFVIYHPSCLAHDQQNDTERHQKHLDILLQGVQGLFTACRQEDA